MKVIYINNAFEKHVSSENIYILILHCQRLSTSTSSQIVEQIEVILEVVLRGISKLNGSALDTKQGDQTQFFSEQRLQEKENRFDIPIIITISSIYGSCCGVIDSFIFFQLSHNVLHAVQKKF